MAICFTNEYPKINILEGSITKNSQNQSLSILIIQNWHCFIFVRSREWGSGNESYQFLFGPRPLKIQGFAATIVTPTPSLMLHLPKKIN